MDPESVESSKTSQPGPATPDTTANIGSDIRPNSNSNPDNPNRDVLASLQFDPKLSGIMHNPKVTGYLGKATKVVAFCAISGCILLVIAIFAVTNLMNQISSAIHP